MSDSRVIIFDTTLRDGEQAPGFSMNTVEKLEMARQLARLQVDVIEAGFPISSDEDFEATREAAKQGSAPANAPASGEDTSVPQAPSKPGIRPPPEKKYVVLAHASA